MDRAAIHHYIDGHLADHIAHIQAWVRQPSVSWDNLGVAECVELAASSYRKLGCQEVEVIPGRYHPGVWAYYDAGAPVTVHNYCMIDTRTVEPGEWSFDPWGAELAAVGPYPKVLVGRGAMGAKGPYVAWLNALETIRAVEGELPFNIMFLAEGEEILGSPAYRQFVERYRDRLSQVDLSFCPSSTQTGAGAVSVGLGLKGMVVLELTAGGEHWAYGPQQTIHSSAASLVDSPPFRLAAALASMVDAQGRGCTVKGLEELWSYRKPLTAEEEELLQKLAARNAGKDWRDVLPLGGVKNVAQVRGGLAGIDPLINFLYGPTFNIAGLYSGFLGWETGTIPFVTPSKASAMLDMRMVVETPPDELVGYVRDHLDRYGFSDIQFEVFAAFSHSQTSVSEPAVQATLHTLAQWGMEPVVWPIEAGGGPWTAVPNAFDVPCVRGGVIGGGNRGNVDEYMVIEGDGKIAGLAEVEKYLVDLIYAVADAVEQHKNPRHATSGRSGS
jgi:acetylornithine deacetylase/succinyl-diaminopimelate desuccinylase-like protein